MKEHEIAAFINRLRDVAEEFSGTQQLRARLCEVVDPVLVDLNHQQTVIGALRGQIDLLSASKPAAMDEGAAWEAYLDEQKRIIGMPGLMARPCFIAGYRAASPQATATLTEDILMQAIADTSARGHVWASRALCNFRAAQKATATQPPQTERPLTDAELTALIRKVEDKLGIVWFVPDDSETYAWRTTNTNERLKYARALLAAPQPASGEA